MRFLLSVVLAFAFAFPVLAQDGGGGMMMDCPMCGMMMQGPWMWLSMLLGAGLVVAVIVALVAASVFLIRRSRGGPQGTASA